MKRLKALLAILLLVTSFAANAMSDTAIIVGTKTATTTSVDINKTGYYTAAILLNVTAVPTVTTLTLSVRGKDAHGNYYVLCTGTASATTGYVTLTVGSTTLNVTNVSCNAVLPDTWDIVVTHSAAGTFTYGVDYNTQ
jgi:hypothetical protein